MRLPIFIVVILVVMLATLVSGDSGSEPEDEEAVVEGFVWAKGGGGAKNVKVKLYRRDPVAKTKAVAKTKTAADGSYKFVVKGSDEFVEGKFYVRVVLPAGHEFTTSKQRPSTINRKTGRSKSFRIKPGKPVVQNAHIRKSKGSPKPTPDPGNLGPDPNDPGNLGPDPNEPDGPPGIVCGCKVRLCAKLFLDNNQDLLQDPEEPGIRNVDVRFDLLYPTCQGKLTKSTFTGITDSEGIVCEDITALDGFQSQVTIAIDGATLANAHFLPPAPKVHLINGCTGQSTLVWDLYGFY